MKLRRYVFTRDLLQHVQTTRRAFEKHNRCHEFRTKLQPKYKYKRKKKTCEKQEILFSLFVFFFKIETNLPNKESFGISRRNVRRHKAHHASLCVMCHNRRVSKVRAKQQVHVRWNFETETAHVVSETIDYRTTGIKIGDDAQSIEFFKPELLSNVPDSTTFNILKQEFFFFFFFRHL